MKTQMNRGLRGGFTMLEVMIATAILATVVIAIYSSWTAILRGSQVGLNAAAEVQRTRMAMKSIEDALGSALMFNENAAHYSFDSDTTSDYALLSLVANLPESFPGSGMFPGQPVRRLTFHVEPDEAGTNQLIMSQVPVLQMLNPDEQPYSIVLGRDVSLFNLEFWDAQLNDWAFDWPQTNTLPRLVRVSLGYGQTKGALSSPESITTKSIALASVAVPREYQMPDPVAVQTPGGRGGQPGQPGGPGGPGGGFRPGSGDRPGRGGDGRPDGGRPDRGFPGGGFPGDGRPDRGFPGDGRPDRRPPGDFNQGRQPGQGFPNQPGQPGQFPGLGGQGQGRGR